MNALVIKKPFHSSNGHTVTSFGRLLYHVSSYSRPGLAHTVDFELRNGDAIKHADFCRCNCEAWCLRGMRPCRHVGAVIEALTANIRRNTERAPARGRVYKLKTAASF